MQKLQPIALTADGNNTYKVRFRTETSEVEFTFEIDEEPFCTLGWDPEFSAMVNGDPAAVALNKAIFAFHEARHFQYAPKTESSKE